MRKKQQGIFPFLWLVLAGLILLTHKPIWYHYYPLVSIPICWLAAYGVDFLIYYFSQILTVNIPFIQLQKLIFSTSLIIILTILIILTPPNPKGSVPKNMEIMQLVEQYKHSTRWMFTDRPIYAFYAGLYVPPEIAVISYKRLNSGQLTTKYMLSILQTYRPEQILLGRWLSLFKSDREFMAYVNNNYSKTYTNEKGTEEHYVLSFLGN